MHNPQADSNTYDTLAYTGEEPHSYGKYLIRTSLMTFALTVPMATLVGAGQVHARHTRARQPPRALTPRTRTPHTRTLTRQPRPARVRPSTLPASPRCLRRREAHGGTRAHHNCMHRCICKNHALTHTVTHTGNTCR